MNPLFSVEKHAAKIISYVGAILIFFGIIFLISTNWQVLSNELKIVSTLGSALLSYTVAILLMYRKKYPVISHALIMLTGLTLPIGLVVVFNVLGWDTHFLPTEQSKIIISGLCLCVFSASYRVFSRIFFLLFIIIFGSLFFLSLLDWMAAQFLILEKWADYEFIILGVSYVLLGYRLSLIKKSPLTGPLYFFGALFILTTSFMLSQPFSMAANGFFWRIMTAVLVFFSFVLALQLKSQSFLYLGAIFLVLYVLEISSKLIVSLGHFGWPFLLIGSGLLFMMIGYLIFYLRRKMLQ